MLEPIWLRTAADYDDDDDDDDDDDADDDDDDDGVGDDEVDVLHCIAPTPTGDGRNFAS